ncbi:hypothetical protein ACWEHA_13830 [Amycolatopsis nivea]
MSGLSRALERELVLAEGADLARRGDYEAAVALLEPDSTGDPARLDLLARVHAQSGDLAAADAAWAAALALQPDNSAAAAGRRVIAKVHSGRLRRRPVRRYLLTAGVVVLVGGAIAGGVVLTTRQSPPPAVTAVKSDDGLRAEVDRLHNLESRESAAARERQEKLKRLAKTLATPGVSTKAGTEAVTVSFDRSLFSPNATTPNAVGRTVLTDWAFVLKGQSLRVTVIGHGVPVPGGPASGGSTVSLARASSAARVLAAESGLPLTAFAVSSADQGADSARTVTLEVRPTGA